MQEPYSFTIVFVQKEDKAMPRILFLAQFAPTDGKVLNTPNCAEEKFYAETYHWKIIEALKNLNYDFDTASDIEYLLKNYAKYQLVWSVYNRLGFRNSEIFVQSLCEYLGIKYIGAAPNVRALVEDKSMSKQLAEHLGIKTANWVVASKQYPLCKIAPFPGKYFVKPRFGASSAFIDENSIATSWEDARKRIIILQEQGIDVIVEKFIDGIFYSVPIYFKDSTIIHLPAIKEKSTLKGNVVTYRQKRKLDSGLTRTVNPDRDLENKLTYLSDSFIELIKPIDYTRIDFMVTPKTVEFIEFNVCCNLGCQSAFCISANSVGISQADLVTQILKSSLKRQKVI